MYSYAILTETIGTNRCQSYHVLARDSDTFFRDHNRNVAEYLKSVRSLKVFLMDKAETFSCRRLNQVEQNLSAFYLIQIYASCSHHHKFYEKLKRRSKNIILFLFLKHILLITYIPQCHVFLLNKNPPQNAFGLLMPFLFEKYFPYDTISLRNGKSCFEI